MNSSAPLLIRADASVAMGAGHIMRCLALAQAWQDAGGNAVFATSEMPAAIQSRLLAESVEVIELSCVAATKPDISRTVALARELKSSWIVVDGYQFGADYQRVLKGAGLQVLFLDDYGHALHYSADIVLNQNMRADERLYDNRETYTQLLLGTQYCLLRREFNAWRDWKREFPAIANKVLVTVGGSDAHNTTLQVVEALNRTAVPELEAMVVIGGGNPHLTSVQQAVADSPHGIRVVTNAANMAKLMAWADMAISGAGSTCWEMCLLGLPALLIPVAQNQDSSARDLAMMGAAALLNTRCELEASAIAATIEEFARSQALRERIGRTARQLVDGNGALRVMAAIENKEERAFGDFVARHDAR
jgi:UDP-2,4-diacetamido-2,4,6-trideoxy-beta-L-altropyranose hydrolase